MPTEKQIEAALTEAAMWTVGASKSATGPNLWMVRRAGVVITGHRTPESMHAELTRARMAAALAAAEAAAWEPIETAKTDGVRELMVCGGTMSDDRTTFREWTKLIGVATIWAVDPYAPKGVCQWIGDEVGQGEYLRYRPTHWRMLPAPPQESKP